MVHEKSSDQNQEENFYEFMHVYTETFPPTKYLQP